MNIVAVETATEACSVAMLTRTGTIERFELAAQGHARLLMPMLQSVMAEAGMALSAVDGFAFGQGPGSFTGVRIATAFVQGLGLGLERPVAGISTLRALAQRTLRRTQALQVASALDARMGQVYWGVFGRNGDTAQPQTEEAVLNPEQLPRLSSDSAVAGMGWRAYAEQLQAATGLKPDAEIELWPHAAEVAFLAAWDWNVAIDAECAAPVYVRQKVAEKKA